MRILDDVVETEEEKEFNVSINELPYITYSYTNENLKAIIKGMQITSKDYVLAILGSGQQGLAMMELGARVDLIDYNQTQIDYFYRILEFMKNPNNSNKSCEKILGKLWCNPSYDYPTKRIINIRKNLNNLKILRKKDIVNVKKDLEEYNKIYFSNALTYNKKNRNYNSRKFANFCNRFNEGTLFYLTKPLYDMVDKEGRLKFPNDLLDKNNLKIDLKLTKIARNIEGGISWSPVIIKRNKIEEVRH